ncbi:hypothetical protein ABT237_07265 [Streptomyces sp. NPDC001581]|uniref:hypothetical protein n=1 Tax=Streptomyces sp. NPDC001581 TaxID=3154386 RepID=UPI00332C9490
MGEEAGAFPAYGVRAQEGQGADGGHIPKPFRFYDLHHTGHTLSTRSGATLKDTMMCAGQSSEKAALIYQHSDHEWQKEVAGGLDDMVRAARQKAAEQAAQGSSGGAQVVRDS